MTSNNKLWGEIPALEYCKVSRAAELISCHVDDLFHWASIGAIELCIELQGITVYSEWFKPGGNEILQSNWCDSEADWVRESSRIENLKYTDEQALGLISGWLPHAYYDREGYLFPRPFISSPLSFVGKQHNARIPSSSDLSIYFLNGLWAVVPAVLFFSNQYHELMRNGSVFLGQGSAFTPADLDSNSHGKAFFYPTPEKSITVAREDFFITRLQIEKILSAKGSVLPSYVNGKISPHSPFRKIHGNTLRGIETNRNFENVLRLIVSKHRNECNGKSGKPTKDATARTFSRYQAGYGFTAVNNINKIKEKMAEFWDTLF